MHIPEKWRLDKQSDIFAFIENYSFATLVFTVITVESFAINVRSR
jgi:predicted FMN-binding regulatory protein PaiB